MENNPLAQYFRTPGVHQALATDGLFFETDEVELAINGEVAILPMTASDEITLKNPDALLNGDALIKLFKSCVPAIRNPRHISVPDMDILLLGIKLASYGDSLEIAVQCPECQKEFNTETSIRGILAATTPVNPADSVLRINDDMIIYLRPYNFEDKTKLDLATFEEGKVYQYLVDADITDEERAKRFNQAFEKIAELNLDILSGCIRAIRIPDQEVTDEVFIRDFVRHSDKNVVQKIQENLKKMSEAGIPKDLDVMCPNEECGHEWKTGMIFDPAHFFA